METMGCSRPHYESGSWLRPCSLALLLYTTGAQAPSRPVADHDCRLLLGWQLCLLKACPPPGTGACFRPHPELKRHCLLP